MVLVNGINGIGTGFKSEIPSFNPRDIVKNLMIDRKEPKRMTPFFKGFKGEIVRLGPHKYSTKDIIKQLPSENSETVTETVKYEITELTIGRGMEDCKIKVMERFMEAPAIITDFREYHTEKEDQFVVYMTQK